VDRKKNTFPDFFTLSIKIRLIHYLFIDGAIGGCASSIDRWQWDDRRTSNKITGSTFCPRSKSSSPCETIAPFKMQSSKSFVTKKNMELIYSTAGWLSLTAWWNRSVPIKKKYCLKFLQMGQGAMYA
jgi:hypothetical protein